MSKMKLKSPKEISQRSSGPKKAKKWVNYYRSRFDELCPQSLESGPRGDGLALRDRPRDPRVEHRLSQAAVNHQNDQNDQHAQKRDLKVLQLVIRLLSALTQYPAKLDDILLNKVFSW